MSAGLGRVDITPPLPIDIVGSSYRWHPAERVHSPLEAHALVLRQGETSVAILTVDLLAVQDPVAFDIRGRVARAIDTDPSHVLLNASHTHAGPQGYPGVKIGGSQRSLSELERLYIEYLPRQVEAAARIALQTLGPVRVAYGRGRVDWAVNRRERAPDGRTILGWNRDGLWDRDVLVLRFDDPSGRPRVFLVNHACHPIVVEDPAIAISSDFVGPLRAFVQRVTGAACLFLQGAAGNVDPLECCFEHPGPEVPSGERIGLEVLYAVADVRSVASEIERLEDAIQSASVMALYRRRPAERQPQQPLAAKTETVILPLLPLPPLDEARGTVVQLTREYQQARDAGTGPEVLNPIEYHLIAAERTLAELEGGAPRSGVEATIQALRIGDCAIAAVPGEVFSEIALNVKEASPAGLTLFAGYSNGLISYIPTAAEYQFGGYECVHAHKGYGLPSAIAPEAERIVTSSCIRLIKTLFQYE